MTQVEEDQHSKHEFKALSSSPSIAKKREWGQKGKGKKENGSDPRQFSNDHLHLSPKFQ
jgi:hypothetical protein